MVYPTRHLDTFSYSKCRAEQKVIAANGSKTKDGIHRLVTCALRPHFVFGPGDTHFMSQIINRAKRGELTHMIGEGHNVTDFTYIDNVVHAHILASSKLSSSTAVQGQVLFFFFPFLFRLFQKHTYKNKHLYVYVWG
ncbi:3beta-hydroxysteroid-dehydrogenase/decarboxylase isoform 2 [Reticulomyxa filosa]|uniref:3beta-hydroxysteroid-dehydrogenase/decarboxylase isoform 2 n=1 Tax=Reticulomyxa filosa TaxID=46433 RepID=X6MJS1_RETFI|nr:3beta-hydroxysteroid-dehydrogenase/decarboxylase isoform 2 [Reticulomyxa filosa]|eukprot:ETO14114.1 3beta-hydroxysteroid-dehydrogenase/decarboxylase isoform 2 [Reticulomyxa filosa]